MWNSKYGTNDPAYATEAGHGLGEQTCPCGGGGSGMDATFGLEDANLDLEWVNDGILLYSSGNYVPSRGLEHDGR